MIGQMRQTVSSDGEINQLQAALNDQFGAIIATAILNGHRLPANALVAGQINNVNHKLGRQALGYFVTSMTATAGALIWNDVLTSTALPLYVSANCTCDLWVF